MEFKQGKYLIVGSLFLGFGLTNTVFGVVVEKEKGAISKKWGGFKDWLKRRKKVPPAPVPGPRPADLAFETLTKMPQIPQPRPLSTGEMKKIGEMQYIQVGKKAYEKNVLLEWVVKTWRLLRVPYVEKSESGRVFGTLDPKTGMHIPHKIILTLTKSFGIPEDQLAGELKPGETTLFNYGSELVRMARNIQEIITTRTDLERQSDWIGVRQAEQHLKNNLLPQYKDIERRINNKLAEYGWPKDFAPKTKF